MNGRTVKSLSISGLITLELHALNNEGAEGNQLQTRQVQVVDQEGKLHAVNAISGDMLKHIQAQHLHAIALERGLPLCAGCRAFDANRVNGDPDFLQEIGGQPGFGAATKAHQEDSYILSQVLKRCVVDDAEGILITQMVGGSKRAIARKSVVEFGWVVGRPEATRTEAYFHVKYAPEGRGKGSRQAGDETGANVGQNIFHRPASSGQYAVVLNVDLFRLGRNDITLEAESFEGQEGTARVSVVLQSVVSTFIKPSGAHRNTQNPHIVDFQGCVALSYGSLPAPTVSALNPDYQQEIGAISASLNRIQPDAIMVHPFARLSQFTAIMADLMVPGAS